MKVKDLVENNKTHEDFPCCTIIYKHSEEGLVKVYDRIDKPTITGKVVYPISDLFILQWEEQRKFYPKGELLGGLF